MSETQQRTAADDLSLALLATRRLMQTVVPTEDDADYAAAGKWKLFSDLCLVSRLIAEYHNGSRPSGLLRVALGTKKPPALGSAED